jgi:hypothetical protein
VKRSLGAKLLGAAVLASCASIACGETSQNDAKPMAGAMAGAAASTGGAGGATSCPMQTPTHGAPCEGALSCNYQAFLGCYPSPVLATCKQGRWEVSNPMPYTGPCPGDPMGPTATCPAQKPAAATSCNQTPTLDGPPLPLVCEYVDLACVDKVVATCNGQWTITPCVPVGAGGAGGAPSEGGAAGAGGAE